MTHEDLLVCAIAVNKLHTTPGGPLYCVNSSPASPTAGTMHLVGVQVRGQERCQFIRNPVCVFAANINDDVITVGDPQGEDGQEAVCVHGLAIGTQGYLVSGVCCCLREDCSRARVQAGGRGNGCCSLCHGKTFRGGGYGGGGGSYPSEARAMCKARKATSSFGKVVWYFWATKVRTRSAAETAFG